MKEFWNWIKSLPVGLTIPVAVILAASIAYLIFFICKFASFQLSNDPEDWANTANYLNLLVSVINLLVFLSLSLLVYQYNIKKDRSDAAFQSTLAKPILVFNSVNEDLNADGTRDVKWQVKNIGNGPALNLWIAYKKQREDNWELPVAKCYSLAQNDSLMLDRGWVKTPDLIVVLYKDTFKNVYGTIVVDDENYVENLNMPSSHDPFGLGITTEVLKGIYSLTAKRLEDILRTPIISYTNSSTSTTETTRRET